MLGSNCKTLLCLTTLSLEQKASEKEDGIRANASPTQTLCGDGTRVWLGDTYFQSVILPRSVAAWLELYMADTFQPEPKRLTDLEKQSL